MKKQELISILITFIAGFLAGVFLYLTGGAATNESVSKVPEAEKLSEFTIVSDVYGGCNQANVCPSFQVLSDGSYRYFHTPPNASEQVLRQGTLPLTLQKELKKVVTATSLSAQSKKITPSLCNSAMDGIDVKYKISLDREEYVIDSCGTAIDDKGQLWTTLGSIWDYFETGGNN